MAVAEPGQTAETIASFLDHPEIGDSVRRSAEWARAVIGDPVTRERAKRSFEGFVDPAEIDRVFDLWHGVVPR